MGRKIFISLAIVAAGVALTSAAQADTKAGINAWAAGDYTLAVNEWQGPADAGDAEAQFQLAQAYRLGKGVPQDLIRAEVLYAKASAQGHQGAADNYGLLLFHRGEKQQAMPYLRAASDRGDARAQYLLGLAYFNADAIERDWTRAYALVNLARKQGLEQANTALQQIDKHISAQQRAEGLSLAEELQDRIDGKPIPQPLAKSPALAAKTTPSLPPRTPAAKPAPIQPAPTQTTLTKPTPAKPAISQPAPVRSASAKPASAKPAPAKLAASGPWRIQLGAFAERGNLDIMWNRVKNRPELSGRSRVNVAAGKVTRLHAAGFPSRAAAQQACTRLKSAGFDCTTV